MIELIVFLVVVQIPLWQIVKRTGHHPAISLVALIPGIGFIALSAFLALKPWPVQQ